jgi:HK97 family phage prohead protease
MLFGHQTETPIGVWDRIIEDRTGLFVSGRIISGNPKADRTARLVKEGALSGLSIGYRARRHMRTSQGRELIELDLWEVSVVAFPMLRTARITQIDDIPSHPLTSQRSIA